MSGTAVIAAGAVGTGAAVIMRAERIAPWTVTIDVPGGGSRVVPAVEAGAAFIAAAVAVCIVLVWYAAATARRRRHWKQEGPTVLHGDTAARATSVSVDGVELGKIKDDVAVLQARVGKHDTAIAAVGEGLIAACENSGQEPPELPDMDEEFPTAPVLRLIRGGEAS